MRRYPTAEGLAPIQAQLGTAAQQAQGGLGELASAYRSRYETGGPFGQDYMARQRGEIERQTRQRLGEAQSLQAQRRARLGRTGLGAAVTTSERDRIRRQGEIDWQRQQQGATEANWQAQQVNLSQLSQTLQQQYDVSARSASMLASLLAMPQYVNQQMPSGMMGTIFGGVQPKIGGMTQF